VGIVVTDIEKSLKFYVTHLGLEKIQEVPVPFGKMHRLAFGNSFLKLIEPKNPVLPEDKKLEQRSGYRYITLQIDNIDEICGQLRSLNIDFTLDKTEFMPGVFIAMVKDPDGNVVEFVERH